MIYQIIRGDITPVTWLFNEGERTITLDLLNAVGEKIQLPIVSTDLAENLSSETIELYLLNHCQWIPTVIIDDGADILKSQDCKVQVTAVPDPPFDFLLPLDSAYLIMYPMPPIPLTTFRDQHVVGSPAFDQRPDGTSYVNSSDWYLTLADRTIVASDDVGPELKIFPDFFEPHQKAIWLEFIRQPQTVGSSWMKRYWKTTLRDYHPTVVKIDVKDGYAGTFHPIQWHISRSEYAAALRSGYLAVHVFLVDILGNCSITAMDTIGLHPPVSSYYPDEDLVLRRRVQRQRGPRESWKQIVTGDEMSYSINRVLRNASYKMETNLIDTVTRFDSGMDDLIIKLEHIRMQRGIT